MTDQFQTIAAAFSGAVLSQQHRPLRLRWRAQETRFAQWLLVQQVDIEEAWLEGLLAKLTCVSSDPELPLQDLLGQPLGIEMVTDRGGLHHTNGIITEARAGQADGALRVYQLTLKDALSIMEERINTRVFRQLSVPRILEIILGEWRQRSPALATAFDFDLDGLEDRRYPMREISHQFNESDAHFIRRLCRREGIAWYVASPQPFAETGKTADADVPMHTLVFCDQSAMLPRALAGTVRYHRDGATEERDTISAWSRQRSLVPGRVWRGSWDYKAVRVEEAASHSAIDQGDTGRALAAILNDGLIEAPHAADGQQDHLRLADARMLAHEGRSESFEASGTVRDLAVGHWFELEGQENFGVPIGMTSQMKRDLKSETIGLFYCIKRSLVYLSLPFFSACSMDHLPRNMPLKTFQPHMEKFICRHEKDVESKLDEIAENWFREGLAITSYDLWPEDRDYRKAAILWENAAKKMHWKAMLNLSSLYLAGRGVTQDSERAVTLVEQAMQMGIPSAYDLMGTYHINGSGVKKDATRAYAFWALAAEMGSSAAQAYLGGKLNANYDDSRGSFWGNKAIGLTMLRCAVAQESALASLNLGVSLNAMTKYDEALRVLHQGATFGSAASANYLAASFATADELTGNVPDPDRADRYMAIGDMLHLNPDLRLPNLDKVLPLPPAILPYWDGDKQSLIDGAKPVKTASLADIKPSPASLRQGRAHIPDGFVLPDEPQGGPLIQHPNTNAVTSGYWIAQLVKPYTPRQVAWNAAQVPMHYEQGESFTPPDDVTKESGVLRFHYLGIPVPKAPAARHVPDWRVPQGVLREIPVPSRELRATGLLPAPATGIWHGRIDPAHPLAKVFNQWNRQAYVEEGQPFPDPRDRGLDISPKEIEWQWLDQANQPLPSGRKAITIRNFSAEEPMAKGS
nr:contractile injection system protein, VgrG/Pvc8 family [Herbaspirillum sp. B39]